jgi:hypothetical protein
MRGMPADRLARGPGRGGDGRGARPRARCLRGAVHDCRCVIGLGAPRASSETSRPHGPARAASSAAIASSTAAAGAAIGVMPDLREIIGRLMSFAMHRAKAG